MCAATRRAVTLGSESLVPSLDATENRPTTNDDPGKERNQRGVTQRDRPPTDEAERPTSRGQRRGRFPQGSFKLSREPLTSPANHCAGTLSNRQPCQHCAGTTHPSSRSPSISPSRQPPVRRSTLRSGPSKNFDPPYVQPTATELSVSCFSCCQSFRPTLLRAVSLFCPTSTLVHALSVLSLTQLRGVSLCLTGTRCQSFHSRSCVVSASV